MAAQNSQWGAVASVDAQHSWQGDEPNALDLGAGVGASGRYQHDGYTASGEYDLRWQERYLVAGRGDFSAQGNSVYTFTTPTQRWDVEVGHRVRAVSAYEDRWWEEHSPSLVHGLSLGSGLNQRLSRQMSVRLSGRLAANFSALSDVAGYSATAQASLNRRWTARSNAHWTVTRQDTLGSDGSLENTLLRADWQHRRTTQQGYWASQVGVTRIDLGSTTEDVLTGGLEGSFAWSGGQTTWQVERTVTSALLQFQLAEVAPEQAQMLTALGVDATAFLLSAPGLMVLDSMQLSQQIATPCALCTWDVGFTAVHQQPQSEDPAQHQYTAQTRFGLALSTRQQWFSGYRLSLQGAVQDGWPDDRAHAWDMGWSKQWRPVTRSQLTATYQRQSAEPERWRAGVQFSLSQTIF